ncbi:hypothetical protein [Microbacterium sp. RURRCA19A]|uniref:hypothetical protein n=1 Tax=Microbacterium sp. RURRCA19A TaxID=1907391 RepID=UPI000954F9C1|nr:hypothetical protein [Microbacterium sp. RURRCA19A]SIS19335.1 hypothetical protein SAMN05880568_3443 [Microbacterium sp. RURRCA19A]
MEVAAKSLERAHPKPTNGSICARVYLGILDTRGDSHIDYSRIRQTEVRNKMVDIVVEELSFHLLGGHAELHGQAALVVELDLPAPAHTRADLLQSGMDESRVDGTRIELHTAKH